MLIESVKHTNKKVKKNTVEKEVNVVYVYYYYLKKAGHSVSAICRRYVRILEKLLDQDDEFKLKYNNIRDEKTNLTCDI